MTKTAKILAACFLSGIPFEASLFEILPLPGFQQVMNGKRRLKFEAAAGKNRQLLFKAQRTRRLLLKERDETTK